MVRGLVFLVLAFAGCSACDSEYEIPRPTSFEPAPAPPLPPAPESPPIPKLEFHPDDILKNLPSGSPPALSPSAPTIAPCTLLTQEEARVLLGVPVGPGEAQSFLGRHLCTYTQKTKGDRSVTIDIESDASDDTWRSAKGLVSELPGFTEVDIGSGEGWRVRKGDRFGVYQHRGPRGIVAEVTSTVNFRVDDSRVLKLMKTIASRL